MAAAVAFEAAHNHIQRRAAHEGSFVARNSYCMGVADDLRKMAANLDTRTEEVARQSEAQEEDSKWHPNLRGSRNPIAVSTPNIKVEGDVTDTDDIEGADATESLFVPHDDDEVTLQYRKRHGPITATRNQDLPVRNRSQDDHVHPTPLEESKQWRSIGQLMRWRDMVKKIEEAVLIDNEIKLRSAKGRLHNRTEKKTCRSEAEALPTRIIEENSDRLAEPLDVRNPSAAPTPNLKFEDDAMGFDDAKRADDAEILSVVSEMDKAAMPDHKQRRRPAAVKTQRKKEQRRRKQQRDGGQSYTSHTGERWSRPSKKTS